MKIVQMVALGAGAVLAASLAHAVPLSLSEAQTRAVERSRNLVALDAAVTASREMEVAARQLPDPVLRLGIDNVPADGGDRFSLTRDFMTMRRIGVMQEVTAANKRALKGEKYEFEAEKGRAERAATLAVIQRETAIAWLQCAYLEAVSATVVAQLRAMQAEIDSADVSYRSGRGSQADVFTARATFAGIEDRQSEIDRKLRSARIELARWVGDDVAQRPLSALPSMDQVPWLEETLEQHLATHPEIQALSREADAAASEARLAQANKRPDWTWEASYQQRGPAYSNMFSIGVSVPLPWDQANRQDRVVASRLAQVEEISARRDEMLRAHVAEVRSSIEEWKSGRERQARYAREILPLAHERTVASMAAYAGARATLNDVLSARRGEFEAKLMALQLDLEVARIWAKLNFLLPQGHSQ